MKPKSPVKTLTPAKGKSTVDAVAGKAVVAQFRKYLSAKFTRRLSQHIHRAKKAALTGRE